VLMLVVVVVLLLVEGFGQVRIEVSQGRDARHEQARPDTARPAIDFLFLGPEIGDGDGMLGSYLWYCTYSKCRS
jgi:hypothetical protein